MCRLMNSEIFPVAELKQNQFTATSISECIWNVRKSFRNGVPDELLFASSLEFHNGELFGKNLRILSEFMSLLGNEREIENRSQLPYCYPVTKVLDSVNEPQ